MLLTLPSIQTWISKRAASFLSDQLHTKVSIQGVYVKFPKNIVLKGLYIEDQHQDTLLFSEEFNINIHNYSFERNRFYINSIKLNKPVFNIKYYQNEQFSNLQFIVNYFQDTTKSNTVKPALYLKIGSLQIIDGKFDYVDQNIKPISSKSINYDDLHISGINYNSDYFTYFKDELRTHLLNLSLKEKSGFVLTQLATDFKMTPTEMEFSKLDLITPRSHIRDYYLMRYDSIADMGNYIEKVYMNSHFDNSKIAYQDVAYFSDELANYSGTVFANGKAYGTVANLASDDIEIKTNDSTFCKGQFKMVGIPDMDHAELYFKAEKLISNSSDIKKILINVDQKEISESIPKELNRLGNFSFAGYYKGRIADFNLKGQLQSEIGGIYADFNMKIPANSPTKYKGEIETIDFDLGKLIAKENIIGNSNLKLSVDGEGFDMDELKTKVEAQVLDLRINNFTYRNLKANGAFRQKVFNGTLTSTEKVLNFDFSGQVDLNNLDLPEFNFDANINRIDLLALQQTKDSFIVSTQMHADFKGANFEKLIGNLAFNNSHIQKGEIEHTIKQLNIQAQLIGAGKSIQIQSELFNAELKGNYHLANISSACKSFLKNFLPSMNFGTISRYENQDFSFKIILADAKPITDLFFPEFQLAKGGSIYGRLNTEKDLLKINCGLDYLKYKSFKLDNLVIDGENNSKVFDLNIASNRILINDSVNINNIAISNAISKDTIQFNIKLSDKNAINQLDLNGKLNFKNDSVNLSILPSEIIIDQSEWKIPDAFNLCYSPDGKLHINNFYLSNATQSLSINGIVSNQSQDELKIKAHQLALRSFNQILKKYSISIGGIMNANATLTAVTGEMSLQSDLRIDDLVYNNDSIGILKFNSTLDDKSKIIAIAGSVFNKTLKTLEIGGSINIGKKEDNLNLNILLDETELSVIEPFVKDYVSKIKGTAIADLAITGSIRKPKLDGYLNLKNVDLTVNYLNTSYTLNDQIKFTEDKILINNVQLKDREGNKGTANGYISHQNFDNFLFDVKVQSQNLMSLNTTAKNNELYYGKAYTSGTYLFKGPLDHFKIDITAATNAGTKLYIPITDENSISANNYIHFVAKDSLAKKPDYKIDLTGIILNMNLQVTDVAEVQLIMDPNTGEAIKGRGFANLKLAINTLGNFEMFGNFEISEGVYNFNIQNIINKKFKIEKGGTIRWNGDPFKAKIDLSAIFETRPSIYPLIVSATNDTSAYSTTAKILSQCVLYMKNDLLAPDISFGLRFPNDQDVSSKVGGYLANSDNLNNQVASLLVLGKFFNSSVTNTSIATSGFINAQLSNLISTKNFNLNLDKGVGGSLKLFNDRITIDGSIANQNTTTITNNTNASAITGDVSIEYKISKDGRLKAKAFQRNDNNSDILKRGNSQNEQGLGVFYRIEFDNFKELWEKLSRKKSE